MPPKRHRGPMRAMGKAKAKAKAKAGAKAKAKAGAKAMAAPRLRRPARRVRGAGPSLTSSERWDKGETVELREVPLEKLTKGTRIVMDPCGYYHQDIKLAGEIQGVELEGAGVYLKLSALGTSHEDVLKLASATSDLMIRVHRCPDGCGEDEVSDTLVHGRKARRERTRLGHESSQSSACPSRRRAGRPTSKSRRCNSFDTGRGRRRCRERQEQEVQEREEERKEEEEEERGSRRSSGDRRGRREILWQESKVSRAEDSPESLRWHRLGWPGESPTSCSGPGQKIPEEEGSQGPQFEQQQRFERILELLPPRGIRRECVHGGIESQTGGRPISRGIELPDPGSNEVGFTAGDWSTRPTWRAEGHYSGVLQAAVERPPEWTHEPGDVNNSIFSGLSGPGTASTCNGYTPSTFQVLREHSARQPLECLPETRDHSPRNHVSHPTGGVGKCPTRCVPGSQAEAECDDARWKKRRKGAEGASTGEARESPMERAESQRWKRSQERPRKERTEGRCGKQELDREERDKAAEDAGVRAPGKEEAKIAGVHSPGKVSSKELDQTEDPYEKGVLAALRMSDGATALESRSTGFCDISSGDLGVLHFTGGLKSSLNSFQGEGDFRSSAHPQKESALNAMSPAETPISPEKMSSLAAFFGKTLGECGCLLQQYILEAIPLRSQSTGKRNSKSLFPLPTSRDVFVALDPPLSVNELSWMVCVCVSLNSLWGEEVFWDCPPIGCQVECVGQLLTEVKRFCALDAKLERFDWGEFLKTRSIDYRGEEVKVARYFEWKNIAPALPAEVGSVPLEAVCTLGSQHYVINFDWPVPQATGGVEVSQVAKGYGGRFPVGWSVPRTCFDWSVLLHWERRNFWHRLWTTSQRFIWCNQGRLDWLGGRNLPPDNELNPLQPPVHAYGRWREHTAIMGWDESFLFTTGWEFTCFQWGCQMFLLHNECPSVLDQVLSFQQTGPWFCVTPWA